MPAEASIIVMLSFAKAQIANKSLGTPTPFTADVAGADFHQGSMQVPTSAGGTAIPTGGVATGGGLFCFKNNNQTNFVTILNAVSGTPFLKILPNECQSGRFAAGVSAPAALADIAITQLEYLFINA